MSGCTQTKKPCCAPTADKAQQLEPVASHISVRQPSQQVFRGLVSLTGGCFRMGADYPEAFPDDGEGPVRVVHLSPFELDRFPVTNTLPQDPPPVLAA